MSIYDDVFYKTEFENRENRLPIEKSNFYPIKDFENEFLTTFKNLRTEDIKIFSFMNDLEKKNFDFISNRQEIVENQFFKNCRNFQVENQTPLNFDEIKIIPDGYMLEHKLNFLVEFLNEFYGLNITPKILKNFLNVFLNLNMNKNDTKYSESKNNLELTEEECRRLIYNNFRKYNFDLSLEEDVSIFKNLIKNTM
jgi:hypothetical protein